ncbi:MAG: hypothetical protein R2755_30030 [Acidimicrobiales bacterium]
MSAPHYVPTSPTALVRSYHSPPRRDRSWVATRPGDLGGEGQPEGTRLGVPGPDQGYAYRLVRLFAGKVFTAEGEHDDDVVAGVLSVAMKRCAIFGRAPVVHDLTVAFAVWGFLDDQPDAELVRTRAKLFEEVSNPHHYPELRRIADAVPESTLRLTPAEVQRRNKTDWRSLLALDAPSAAHD